MVVKGFGRSIILDLHREKFDFIPNDLSKFISENNNKLVNLNDFSGNRKTIKSYIDFLSKSEYIFPKFLDANEIRLFPKLKLYYERPYIINSVILFDNVKALIKLNELNCYFIQLNIEIIFSYIPSRDEIQTICKLINKGIINSIAIIVIPIFHKSINYIIEEFSNIDIFVRFCYSSILISDNLVLVEKSKISILKYDKKIQIPTNELSQVNFSQFMINQYLYLESIKYNTYFNKKIFIDPEGNIKNTLSLFETFSNINEIKNPNQLLKIVSDKKYQQYWHVNKKMIDVCKNCEFRHVCVDNRIPEQRKINEWFMKNECNYNPYISKWKGESGYKTLKECGIISDKYRFSINIKKVNAINKELWAT